MDEEIKILLQSIHGVWFNSTVEPKISFISHTISELDKAGYEIVKKNTWQPIETAPRDGTDILIFSVPTQGSICDGYACAYWDGRGWFVAETNEYDIYSEDEPTHWMPIPKWSEKEKI